MLPEGYVLAYPDSPQWMKDAAKVDGLLCDGVDDHVEINRAFQLAASTKQATVITAPGNARDIKWSRHPGSSTGWYSAIRPILRNDGVEVVLKTLPGLEHWTVWHTEVRPDPSRFNLEGGYNNIFLWVPKHDTAKMLIRGISTNGRSAEQVTPSTTSRQNLRWSMSGGRDWGTPGFRMEKCRFMNWRGTTGGGGPQETGFWDVYAGMLDDCLFVAADGGDCATMSGIMNATGGRIIRCEFQAPKGNINHGCAMWKADKPVRWGLKVSGKFLSSGVRSEVSTNVIDVDIDVEGVEGMGFVSQCVQEHDVHQLRVVDSGFNNLALNRPRGFRLHSIKGATAAEQKANFGPLTRKTSNRDIQFFAHEGCPGGVPTPETTQCYADLSVLRDRVRAGELTVAQWPANSFDLAKMGL